jgi:hypothetical protein
MIEGITVLNQTEITDMPFLVFVIGLIMIFVSLTVTIIGIHVENGIYVVIGSIAITVSMIIPINIQQPTGRYKYECIIDESVDFVNIYEKYKVIEQRGDIWVLEDKESEE